MGGFRGNFRLHLYNQLATCIVTCFHFRRVCISFPQPKTQNASRRMCRSKGHLEQGRTRKVLSSLYLLPSLRVELSPRFRQNCLQIAFKSIKVSLARLRRRFFRFFDPENGGGGPLFRLGLQHCLKGSPPEGP